MSLSRLRMGRRSTCDPGRNAFTPPRMVTERPPFTRWLMVPSDRKSTRLNSSHSQISYAVFCLKKKNNVHAGARPPDVPGFVPPPPSFLQFPALRDSGRLARVLRRCKLCCCRWLGQWAVTFGEL